MCWHWCPWFPKQKIECQDLWYAWCDHCELFKRQRTLIKIASSHRKREKLPFLSQICNGLLLCEKTNQRKLLRYGVQSVNQWSMNNGLTLWSIKWKEILIDMCCETLLLLSGIKKSNAEWVLIMTQNSNFEALFVLLACLLANVSHTAEKWNAF